MRGLIKKAGCSGSIAGIFMAAVIAATDRFWTGTGIRALNGISHMVWGSRAIRQTRWSWQHTGAGLALNQLACIFWAGLYEAIAGNGRMKFSTLAWKATGISLAAYVTDYHVVPSRFTPGFEHALPRRSFPVLYAGLAVSLVGGYVLRRLLVSCYPIGKDGEFVAAERRPLCGASRENQRPTPRTNSTIIRLNGTPNNQRTIGTMCITLLGDVKSYAADLR